MWGRHIFLGVVPRALELDTRLLIPKFYIPNVVLRLGHDTICCTSNIKAVNLLAALKCVRCSIEKERKKERKERHFDCVDYCTYERGVKLVFKYLRKTSFVRISAIIALTVLPYAPLLLVLAKIEGAVCHAYDTLINIHSRHQRLCTTRPTSKDVLSNLRSLVDHAGFKWQIEV